MRRKSILEEAPFIVAAGIRMGLIKKPLKDRDLVAIGIARGWIIPASKTRVSSRIEVNFNQEEE
jgi:hypothetical protein